MFKYLFSAILHDGTIIAQNQQDQGSIEGKNCYYDVIQAENAGKLRAFALYNQETGDEFLIDIGGDCHFECNSPHKNDETGEIIYSGTSFKLHGEEKLRNIRLIWFIQREMVLDVVNTQVIANKIKSYNFGFQGSLPDGSNFQRVVTLE